MLPLLAMGGSISSKEPVAAFETAGQVPQPTVSEKAVFVC